jgi:hypothetical protein
MRTPTPRTIDKLLRRGSLKNARFAASVIVEGIVDECPTTVRWDVAVPSLFLLQQQGLLCSPISWATARMAALFIKHFPRDQFGVFPPESIPIAIRRAILRDARARGFGIVKRVTSRAPRDL